MTITTFISALIITIVLIIFQISLFYLRLNQFNIPIQILLIFNYLIIFRLLFPFELPYTITLPSRYLLTNVINFLKTPLLDNFKLFDLLLIIWIIGFLIKTFNYFYKSLRLNSILEQFSEPFRQNDASLDAINNISIYYFPLLYSPMVKGLFRPKIFLPRKDYDEKELYYIIRHELIHVKNRDIHFKTFFEFILLLLWWIPFLKVYAEFFSTIFELNVDEIVTKELNKHSKKLYINTLVKSGVQCNNIFIKEKTSLFFSNKKYLFHRIKILIENRPIRYSNKIVYGILCLLFFITTCFTFEPYYEIPSSEKIYMKISSDNSYFIVRGDKFEWIVNGESWGIIKNISDIPGYENIPLIGE